MVSFNQNNLCLKGVPTFEFPNFGLEIPFKVPVSLLGTCANLLLLERNKQLTKEFYLKPRKEEVFGSLPVLIQALQPSGTMKKKTKKNIE